MKSFIAVFSTFESTVSMMALVIGSRASNSASIKDSYWTATRQLLLAAVLELMTASDEANVPQNHHSIQIGCVIIRSKMLQSYQSDIVQFEPSNLLLVPIADLPQRISIRDSRSPSVTHQF